MTKSTIATKLSTLNVLRAAAGKQPLASWKNSEAELDQRIVDLTPGQNISQRIPADPDRTEVLKAMGEAIAASDVPVTKVPTGVTKKAQDKKAAKQAKKPTKAPAKAKVKPATTTPRSGNEFGALLTELKLDPKKARAKLRNAGMSAPYTDLAAIRKVLTTDGRKKAK